MSPRQALATAARATATGLAVFVVWASTGCSAPTPNLCQRLQDEDPSVRVAAVIEAGKTKDPNAIPFLVDRLGDTETEVRFFAALALEKITGQTRGYRYYESSDRREEAIACWRQWLETQAASRPASQPTSQGRQESAP